MWRNRDFYLGNGMITNVFDAANFFANRFKHLETKPVVLLLRGWYVEDGDTVAVLRDVGAGRIDASSMRIYGVDTPENHTPDVYHKQVGNIVKECVERWLDSIPHNDLQVIELGQDKYAGRYLGDFCNRRDVARTLSRYLLEHKMAKPYLGDTKSPWTVGELKTVELAARVELAKPYVMTDLRAKYVGMIDEFLGR